VLIHFDAFAARLVSERQWHPTQKIKRLADGEIELSMTLGSLEEVERWILSWGEHASVLEPAALIRRIRAVAETLRRRYTK
jgi:predicted DNA-binding transcriptional regulator YafY